MPQARRSGSIDCCIRLTQPALPHGLKALDLSRCHGSSRSSLALVTAFKQHKQLSATLGTLRLASSDIEVVELSLAGSGKLVPQWAAACPASYEADAELPLWRVQVGALATTAKPTRRPPAQPRRDFRPPPWLPSPPVSAGEAHVRGARVPRLLWAAGRASALPRDGAAAGRLVREPRRVAKRRHGRRQWRRQRRQRS